MFPVRNLAQTQVVMYEYRKIFFVCKFGLKATLSHKIKCHFMSCQMGYFLYDVFAQLVLNTSGQVFYCKK